MTKVLYAAKWISLLDSEQGDAYVQMGDGVMMVPLTPGGEVVFIEEYSPAYDKRVLYLPTGSIDSSESDERAANRELQEEVGYRTSQIELLGDLYPGIKYVQQRIRVFLVRDLAPSKLKGDEAWEITPTRLPLAELDNLIRSGRLQDSTVIAALFMARTHLFGDDAMEEH
jgi:ADP-ribose diphosphatase